MSDEFVIVDRRDDGVAVVRLDRPRMNALSTAVLDQLAAVAADLTREPPGAVVVTGGERVFAAGADIGEFGGPKEARVIGAHFRHALDTLAAIPRVTIAAVSGYALGGGCELALACDLRVASATATFGQPEVLLGIIPGGGATQRLPRLIGASRAKEMILTGRQVPAGEAHRMGLVDVLAPPGRVLDVAVELAAGLARGPLRAHALAKRAIDRGLDLSLEEGLALEQELFAEVFTTDDARTGVRSFRDHGPGKARFTGK